MQTRKSEQFKSPQPAFRLGLRAAAVLAVALLAAGCKWTSSSALLTEDVIDNSPLKPGNYVHGDMTYKIEGKNKGPIVVTTLSGSTATTYSVAFDKIGDSLFGGDKFYLVQAVTGSEPAYELIQVNKDGFVEYRMDCKDEDETLAKSAGATIHADDNACVFPTYAALKSAASKAADAIKAGAPGYPGDSYIRQK